jgi:hypothetical protein
MSRLTLAAVALCLTPSAVLGARVARDTAAGAQSLQRAEQAEQANIDGKNVCCLLSLEPDFEVTVYHAGRGQWEVRKCLLESEVKGCEDDPECKSKCGTFMKGTRRYRDLVTKQAEKEAADAGSAKTRVFAQADKDLQATQQQATQAFEGAVKGPREQVAAAGKVLEARKSDRAAKEAIFGRAKAAQEAAQKDFDGKKSEKEAAEQQAAAEKARAESEAQAAAAAKKLAADAKVAEKEQVLQQKKAEAAGFTAQAVPAGCQDPSSPSGAKDCCCSIGHQAMRVSGELFVDWDTCKGAKAYSQTFILSFPCGYLTPCDTCANLICGTGMCP